MLPNTHLASEALEASSMKRPKQMSIASQIHQNSRGGVTVVVLLPIPTQEFKKRKPLPLVSSCYTKTLSGTVWALWNILLCFDLRKLETMCNKSPQPRHKNNCHFVCCDNDDSANHSQQRDASRQPEKVCTLVWPSVHDISHWNCCLSKALKLTMG